MSPTTDERCGFRLHIGLDSQASAADPCERPVWEDHDRCVWHATVDGKTAATFDDRRADVENSLDGAYLRDAELVDLDWLRGASLVGADLTGARLNGSDLSGANLMLSSLKDVSALNTDLRGVNLEGAILTNGDLRRATLENAHLNDAVLKDVHIDGTTTFGELSVYERERADPVLGAKHPLLAAAWAYRQLQQVYRGNSLPDLARRSYNREKDARRKLAWSTRDYPKAIALELSRWVMRYGNSPYRIFIASLGVITVSALLFPLTGGIQETQGEQVITYAIDDPTEAPQWWLVQVLFKSMYFSVVTFATLGYGDIQPIGTWARLLATVETTLGTLLSALLVFVLARLVTW
ncbi:pentapeptide repeat-containing protein [Halobellus sp. GM3]|uniref:pentapeptide repeat-containing protein n=1 Tax=Halobellus sp. GM3 TaxID=3458410 RepID=UPI00403E2B85